MNHTELGKLGETLARKALINKGYKVLESNYRWKKTEIDIICANEDLLIFVEVKTRQSNYFGEPYGAVSKHKQRQIIKVANKYIEMKNLDVESRFDVVSIVHNARGTRMEHIEGAFIPLI